MDNHVRRDAPRADGIASEQCAIADQVDEARNAARQPVNFFQRFAGKADRRCTAAFYARHPEYADVVEEPS